MAESLSKYNKYEFLNGNVNAATISTPLEEANKTIENKSFANYTTGALALAIPPTTIQACSNLREINVNVGLMSLANMCSAIQNQLKSGGKIFGLVNPAVVAEYMPILESVNDLSDSMKERATFSLEYMDQIAMLEGIPVWDILPGERVDFYNVFKLYRDSRYFLLDTGEYVINNRTIAGLSKQLGVSGSILTYISKLYSWQDRCVLYDAYMSSEMQKRKAQQEVMLCNEHLKMAQQLTSKAWDRLTKQINNLNPKELLQMFELGIKYSRISAGMLSDKPDNTIPTKQTTLSIYNNTTNNSAEQMMNIHADNSSEKIGSIVERKLAEDMKDENNLLSILHVLQASGAMKTAVHTDLINQGESGLGIVNVDEEVDE